MSEVPIRYLIWWPWQNIHLCSWYSTSFNKTFKQKQKTFRYLGLSWLSPRASFYSWEVNGGLFAGEIWWRKWNIVWPTQPRPTGQPCLPRNTPALLTVISQTIVPAAEKSADNAGEGNLEFVVRHHVDYRIQCGVEITCNDHLFIRKYEELHHENFYNIDKVVKLSSRLNEVLSWPSSGSL